MARSSAGEHRGPGDSGAAVRDPAEHVAHLGHGRRGVPSWPVTSPMTSMVGPSPTVKASYQSPPTCACAAAGT